MILSEECRTIYYIYIYNLESRSIIVVDLDLFIFTETARYLISYMRNLIQIAASLWRNTAGGLKKVNCEDLPSRKSTLFVDNRFRLRFRIFLRDLNHFMEGSPLLLHPSLRPPSCVHGITDLQKDTFVKHVKVPGMKIPKRQISSKQKFMRPHLLKMKGVSPIGELANDDPLKSTHSLVLFDPNKVEDGALSEGVKKLLGEFGYDAVEKYELELGYDNWSVTDILKAVLPKESEGVSSFTQIGHIAHLNLKPENMPFKSIIGQVILDKIPSVKTVVNKLNTIDNTYRNFEMELLAGENNYITQTKENNNVFELDFSKVYWNSRLSTEHQRIVDAVQRDSIVYDVFAGVGPFAIPLAKKKGCTVFANDLNPHSFQSLERNTILNKIKTGHVYTHNLDGREFIRSIVKSDLIKRLNHIQSKDCAENENGKGDSKYITEPSYAIMNLPALAVDFLDSFNSLLSDLPEHLKDPQLIDHILPIVHCYAFCSKGENVDEEVKERAQLVIKQPLPPDSSVRIVRNVSPKKEMVCLSFKLWSQLVLDGNVENGSEIKDVPDEDEPLTKKQKCIS